VFIVKVVKVPLSSSSSSSSLLLPRFFPLFCLCEMWFLCDVSLSLLRFEGPKKSRRRRRESVRTERTTKERKEKGKRKTKKGSRAVGIRFGFFGQKHKEKASLFLLSRRFGVEEN
jgi:hypothetical protein